MLTSYADDEALFAAIMAGAAGYVLKQVENTDLVDAVRRVAAGQSLLDPVLTERVLARLREGPQVDSRLASLTPQERRILDLIADGQTNRQIAASMYLAEKTVKNYVSNVLAKLGMERRTQAATYAARLDERTQKGLRGRRLGHVRPDRHRCPHAVGAGSLNSVGASSSSRRIPRDTTACSSRVRSCWGWPNLARSTSIPRRRESSIRATS